MKINYKFISCLVLITFFLGCEDKLDQAPLGELNSQSFYRTIGDFEAASLTPYSTLLNFYYEQGGRGYFNGILRPSDDVRHGGQGIDNFNDFNWLPNNGDFSWMFNQSYVGIMRSNVILDRLPQAEFGDEDKARFEAEARFIRAYLYFFLANNWGNPPLITELITSIDDTQIPNSAPGEVLDFVEQDLIFAKGNLPASWSDNNVGRATSGAAQALLGKVYLYREKYTQAATELQGVVSSNVYSLLENYGDNFREDSENNAESIFEIQQTRGDFNPWLPVDFGLPENQNVGHAGTSRTIIFRASCFLGECAPGANGQGYGGVHITQPLQDAFEADDPRIPYIYFRPGDDYFGTPYNPAWSITGATPSKYLLNYVEYAQPNAGSNNERVIRYSDVLLMLAEAELLGSNNITRAAELVNEVRRRADPSGAILPDRNPGSADEMMEFIMHERRVELALEGHRYDDLVRWHRAGIIDISTDIDFGSTTANQNWTETHLLKPYPQGELDLNLSLEQNPGY